MPKPVVALVDNGSIRPAAVASLRFIAARLSAAVDQTVHPVSLRHVGDIPPDELDGEPAWELADFLRRELKAGRREFVLLPLLFSRSRALKTFVTELVGRLSEELGPFDLHLAEALSPMPEGEPLLADILADHVAACGRHLGEEPGCVVVVDHGSPQPEVTAVRAKATMDLRARLPAEVVLSQAVMERRQGAEYDFNGQLLGDLLDTCGTRYPGAPVVLAMMFVSPGRHAGPGGDVAAICAAAMQRNPGLRVVVSPLVGEHPLLVEILRRRLDAVR